MADLLAGLGLASASMAVLILLADVQRLMSVALALTALPWALRLWREGRLTVRTPLDGPWTLFVLTAAVGVWAAYDSALAWPRFRLIIGGVGLYYALANATTARSRIQPWVIAHWSLGLCLVAAVMGVYYVTQRDWEVGPTKFGAIASLGTWIAARTPRVPGQHIWHSVHSNILAGVLAVLWPINTALAVTSGKVKAESLNSEVASSTPPLLVSLSALLLISFALIMTESRGAWLALGTVGGLWLLGRLGRRWVGRRSSPEGVRPSSPSVRRERLLAGAIAAGAMAIGLALLACSVVARPVDAGRLADWVGSVPIGERALNRLDLYRQTLTLVRDYPLTGSGLGCFTMVYSTYLLLVHVPFVSLVDNLFLQIAVEQGVLGLVAFGWLVGAFFWSAARARGGTSEPLAISHQLSAIHQAACWAVVVILVHGLVHGTLYASWTLPLLFVPFGLAMATSPESAVESPVSRLWTTDYRPYTSKIPRRWVVTGLLLAVGLAIAGLVWRGPLLGLFFSNLGAVHQTRAELSIYEWPTWPIQDAVRRHLDLSRPVAELERALAYDPGNATANRRLGMIELSLGQYERAMAHLERAYASEPGNETTRQLLGEALIANGQLEAGGALWRTVENGQGQLGLRQWWYEHIGDEERAESVRQVMDGR